MLVHVNAYLIGVAVGVSVSELVADKDLLDVKGGVSGAGVGTRGGGGEMTKMGGGVDVIGFFSGILTLSLSKSRMNTAWKFGI